MLKTYRIGRAMSAVVVPAPQWFFFASTAGQSASSCLNWRAGFITAPPSSLHLRPAATSAVKMETADYADERRWLQVTKAVTSLRGSCELRPPLGVPVE